MSDLPDQVTDLDQAPDGHRLVTEGVASLVYDSDRQPIGHVVLTEYDDESRETAAQDARDLPGPAVLLRSSERCWHVWGLCIWPWKAAYGLAQGSAGSSTYLDQQGDRGRMVLRDMPKLARDGSVYRGSPVPVEVFDGDAGRPVSRPHVTTLRDMADEADAADVLDGLATVESEARAADGLAGRTLTRERYETISDELAEVFDSGR